MFRSSRGGTAHSFALVLAFYLGGIGYGSLAVHDRCRRQGSGSVTVPGLAAVILWAGIAGFLVAPAAAWAVIFVPSSVVLPLVFVGATLLGAALPLLSHASIGSEEQAGRKLSGIYLANIAGSASGSFLVGFVLMNYWGVRAICVFLLALGACAALVLLFARHGRITRAAAIGASVAVVLASCSGPLFSRRWLAGAPSVATAHSRHIQLHWMFNDRVIAVSED